MKQLDFGKVHQYTPMSNEEFREFIFKFSHDLNYHRFFIIPEPDLSKIIQLSKTLCDEETYQLYVNLCGLYPKRPFLYGTNGKQDFEFDLF